MTMRKWRFLPILVKQEVLKQMDLSDRFSFAKCSKKSCKLLSGVPNHLRSVMIEEESFAIDEILPFSLRDFPLLIACSYSTIEHLRVFIQTVPAKFILDNIIRPRRVIKVKRLEMRFHAGFDELYKELIEICDPSILRTIKIPRLCTTQIYLSIVNTEQWKKCEGIYLNNHISAQYTSSLQVNYDNFLHLTHIYIGVDTINREDALKLVKMYLSFTDRFGGFEVSTRDRIEKQAVINRICTEYPTAAPVVGYRGADYIRNLWVPGIRKCALELQPTYFSFRGEMKYHFSVALELIAALMHAYAREAGVAAPP